MTRTADREVATFWRYVESSLDRIVGCLEEFDGQQLDWRPPAKGSNSLYVLAAHTLANAEENILGTLCGQEVERHREDEFVALGGSARMIEDRWLQLRGRIGSALAELPASVLDREVRHPRRGDITGREVLLVVARHAAEHLGQAELTRDLLRTSQLGRHG